ncbi:hypothetical protein GCM10009100_31660 [Thalassospira tepidiphila]
MAGSDPSSDPPSEPLRAVTAAICAAVGGMGKANQIANSQIAKHAIVLIAGFMPVTSPVAQISACPKDGE